jgi:adenine phosphoribosyltransferase
VIVGLDARGFIFAPALALRLNVRFIPIRKRGKLPGETVQAKYVKEYGEDIFEMQKGRMTSDDRVVVVDDLIATGACLPTDGC